MDQMPLFEHLKMEGSLGLLSLLLTVVCTVALLVGRIRGCWHPRPNRGGRDLTFLLCGPVATLLYAAGQSASAVQADVQGGIDADFGLRYGLASVRENCGIALVCFIIGVIAFMLPAKSPDSPSNPRSTIAPR